MNFNYTKLFKLYTKKLTQLELVLMLRDEWISIIDNRDPQSDGSIIFEDFKKNKIITKILEKLKIDKSSIAPYMFYHKDISKIFIYNTTLLKCLIDNNLICLNNISDKIQGQRILANNLTCRTITKPHLYKYEDATFFIKDELCQLRYIKVYNSKKETVYYDLIDTEYLFNDDVVRYSKINIVDILDSYIKYCILPLDSLEEMISECSESKIFEFIHTSDKHELNQIAGYLIGMPTIYQSYCSETYENNEVMKQFKHYMMTKLFKTENAKNAVIADELDTPPDVIKDLLIGEQLNFKCNTEIETIEF